MVASRSGSAYMPGNWGKRRTKILQHLRETGTFIRMKHKKETTSHGLTRPYYPPGKKDEKTRTGVKRPPPGSYNPSGLLLRSLQCLYTPGDCRKQGWGEGN